VLVVGYVVLLWTDVRVIFNYMYICANARFSLRLSFAHMHPVNAHLSNRAPSCSLYISLI